MIRLCWCIVVQLWQLIAMFTFMQAHIHVIELLWQLYADNVSLIEAFTITFEQQKPRPYAGFSVHVN